MPTNFSDKIDDLEPVLLAVPLSAYHLDKEVYPWPRRNRCTFCLVGKFKLVNGVLICTVCEAEFHIQAKA